MSKDDYQKKIEEHRQSIGLENETTELRRSRKNATGKKKKDPINYNTKCTTNQ